MKRCISTLFIILLSINLYAVESPNWMTSLDHAKKLAKAIHKPILVDFWAVWCGPCKKMDSDVWSEQEVVELTKAFIPVKIDIDMNTKLAVKYNVKSIPKILILDSRGNVLYDVAGYKYKHEVLKLLDSFTLDFQSVNIALLALDAAPKKNYTNIRVAQKYQDLAYDATGYGKSAMIRRSNYYLRKGAKSTKKKKIGR